MIARAGQPACRDRGCHRAQVRGRITDRWLEGTLRLCVGAEEDAETERIFERRAAQPGQPRPQRPPRRPGGRERSEGVYEARVEHAAERAAGKVSRHLARAGWRPTLSVRNLGTIVGLVGASAGMMISFIVPCACYVVLSFGWTPTRVASLFTLVLGVLLLPVCVGVELMS